MELSQGIRRIGFRRWYERQLIESHLYLVSGVLALFAALACVEGFSPHLLGSDTLFRLVAMMAGIVVCLWTFRRYLRMLAVAEHAAECSVCEKCRTYRGLDVAKLAVPAVVEEGELEPVGVRCRKCGHEWTIE